MPGAMKTPYTTAAGALAWTGGGAVPAGRRPSFPLWAWGPPAGGPYPGLTRPER